jgi:hypothetical protein
MTTAARYYSLMLPGGMLPGSERLKKFSSISAFDSYVAYIRGRGYQVLFVTPIHASVTRGLL